jgi:signal transduction histidine kinase
MTLSQILLDGSAGRLDPTQRRYVEVIRRNGETVLRLVDDFIDMFRLESGHINLSRVSFDVRDAISRVLVEIQPLADVRGLELRLASARPSRPVPRVVADPERVGQVLANLVGNAIKFTDAGRITVSVEAVDGAVAVHIADTGIGIQPSDIPEVFEEFFQGAQGGQRSRGGSGLGLAISKGLVVAMGGDLKVTSSPGEGSRFTFTLPRERRSRPAAIRPTKTASPGE